MATEAQRNWLTSAYVPAFLRLAGFEDEALALERYRGPRLFLERDCLAGIRANMQTRLWAIDPRPVEGLPVHDPALVAVSPEDHRVDLEAWHIADEAARIAKNEPTTEAEREEAAQRVAKTHARLLATMPDA